MLVRSSWKVTVRYGSDIFFCVIWLDRDECKAFLGDYVDKGMVCGFSFFLVFFPQGVRCIGRANICVLFL